MAQLRGLGSFLPADLVPMRVGSTPAIAQQSCINATGEWVKDTQGNYGCRLPNNPDSNAWYCNIPFSSSLFSDCALPASPADLLLSGPYVAYQAGMIQGNPEATKTLIAQDTAQGEVLLSQQTPDYFTAANNPALSQIFGVPMANLLLNPFATNGWVIYAAVAVAGIMLYSNLKGKR